MSSARSALQAQPLEDATGWRERIQSASSIALFLDFDGTLSPISASPTLAKVDGGIRSVIEDLASRDDIHVAIVSGRQLCDVRTRVGLTGIIYAGNHGLEIEGDTVCFREPQSEHLRFELRHLVLQLELALSGTPGIEIEQKGLGASIHYRQVNKELHAWVRTTVQQTIERSRSFKTASGKMVIEVRPSVEWHKGHAVRWILDRVLPPGAFPIYVGDDNTDEDAFCLLSDALTVRVGLIPDTCAKYWIPDIAAVGAFLSDVGSLRPHGKEGPEDLT
jgi:trehalose 6-phosphate phosphatase